MKTPALRTHMHTYRHAQTYRCRIAYSVVNKKDFPQLRIKCGEAKSCPGTHTALQAPM